MGAECLGYTDLVTWVGGIASRGRMKGRTFELPSSPQPPMRNNEPQQVSRFVSRVVGPDGGLLAMRGPLQATVPDAFSAMVMPVPSMPRALADPIFQDLDHDSRELIMYCK
jgi:hypothetical protein